MLFFWSLLAFALFFVLLWLIFVANDDTVLRTLRIPTDGDVDGDGDVDAADVAALKASVEQEKLSAPARVAAMDAKYEAASDVAAASAAVAEAADASMQADASGSAEAVAAAQEAIDAADAAVAEAAEAIEEAAAAVDATQDKAFAEVEAASERPAGLAAGAPAAEAVEDVTRAVTVFDEESGNYPDDLTKIDGIGEVYQQRLYAAGVTTWARVADTDSAQLESITEASENSHPAEWPRQALALAEANDRMDAVYVGPTPDRLIVLPGIGEGTQETLRKHGLVTYVQIAETDPAVLATMLKSASSRASASEVIAAANQLAEKSA